MSTITSYKEAHCSHQTNIKFNLSSSTDGGYCQKGEKNGGLVTEKADGQTQKPATDSYVILSNLKKSRKERRVKTISETNSTDYQIESQSEG